MSFQFMTEKHLIFFFYIVGVGPNSLSSSHTKLLMLLILSCVLQKTFSFTMSYRNISIVMWYHHWFCWKKKWISKASVEFHFLIFSWIEWLFLHFDRSFISCSTNHLNFVVNQFWNFFLKKIMIHHLELGPFRKLSFIEDFEFISLSSANSYCINSFDCVVIHLNCNHLNQCRHGYYPDFLFSKTNRAKAFYMHIKTTVTSIKYVLLKLAIGQYIQWVKLKLNSNVRNWYR